MLGKRHSNPNKAASEPHSERTWTMPSGKPHFQDGIKETPFGEVLEETGIKINKENLEIISISNDIVYDNHFVTIGFLCREFEGEPRIMELDEITKWQWFDLNNLPSPIFPPSEKIIKNYLAKKLYHDN